MLWLTWQIWILLTLAFAGGVITVLDRACFRRMLRAGNRRSAETY